VTILAPQGPGESHEPEGSWKRGAEGASIECRRRENRGAESAEWGGKWEEGISNYPLSSTSTSPPLEV